MPITKKHRTKTSPKKTVTNIAPPTLKKGERWAGICLGEDGKPSHHLILLPGEAESVTWDQAKTWAKKAGGELPTRQEQSLLYANLKAQFKSAWYWSGEQPAADDAFAWDQSFGGGGQGYWHKVYGHRARAVRRLVIRDSCAGAGSR